MARRDGTGPTGQGPLTGRGLGNCTGASPTARPYGGGAGAGFGRGANRGFGRGAGLGYRCRRPYGAGYGAGYGARYGALDNKEAFSQEKAILQDRLNTINKQLEDN